MMLYLVCYISFSLVDTLLERPYKWLRIIVYYLFPITEKHSETLANRTSMFGKREKRFTPEDIQVPKFYKLDAPSGRNVFVELGIIVDQVSVWD